MGLLEKIRGEFVDIVEWIDDTRHTLVWRFPRYHNQIKYGAQLIVRPGQVAVFVDRGRLADVFQPGQYELKTANIPVLSTLQGWKFGFDSPFKAEVYFVSTRQVTDLKWGTPNPVMLRDPEFGPVRMRAFGTYTLKASDPKALLKELVGTDGSFEADEVSELMRSMIVSAFSELLAKKQLAALDVAANFHTLSEEVRNAVVAKVDDEYGLDVPQLIIVNVSFPEAVERALDTRTSMSVTGDLGRYQQYQMGSALTLAAGSGGGSGGGGGGGAAEGMGAALGFALANQMVQGTARAGAIPPPFPAGTWHVAMGGDAKGPVTLEQVAQWLAMGSITGGTLVWSNGMANWTPLRQVPQLAQLLVPHPPPLPPQ